MGTPKYAQDILQALIDDADIEVLSVFTQPDKPVGRKKILTPPPVKETALKYGIKLFQPITLKNQDIIKAILEQKCDYIIVAAYGQIVPKEIVSHLPCINLHASILPKYRGASPIQQALLHGDDITGITAMKMDEGLDTGDIIKIQKCDISPEETSIELFQKLTLEAVSLTLDVIKNYHSYSIIPQDSTEATYCKKISKEDGLIRFDNAREIYNKYRAFISWPGIYLESGLKIKEIKIIEENSQNKEGSILGFDKGIIVGCVEGSLEILTLQPPSKKEMQALAYVNGKRLEIADSLT